MNVDLSAEEIKTITEILKFSLGSCPVESISDQVEISAEGVEQLIAKLEKSG